MDGASRSALATGRDQLERLLGQVDPAVLADELQLVGRTLDSSAGLRRALADPTRDDEAKRGLVEQLFGGRTGQATRSLLSTLVAQRWHAERDLGDAVDLLLAETLLAGAEREGTLERTEHELFELGRTVQGSPELRDALSDRRRSGDDKARLLAGLLEGRATPQTVRLAGLAAADPRGQRVDQALERYTQVAARRRDQVTALVTAAAPLAPEHLDRLTRALTSLYGRAVQVNVAIDPEVVGGLRVQVGDEVIDGTVARRLDDARRALAG